MDLLRAVSGIFRPAGQPELHRTPTLASESQRHTLKQMVTLSLRSPNLLRATRAADPLRFFGAVLRDERSTGAGFGRSKQESMQPQASISTAFTPSASMSRTISLPAIQVTQSPTLKRAPTALNPHSALLLPPALKPRNHISAELLRQHNENFRKEAEVILVEEQESVRQEPSLTVRPQATSSSPQEQAPPRVTLQSTICQEPTSEPQQELRVTLQPTSEGPMGKELSLPIVRLQPSVGSPLGKELMLPIVKLQPTLGSVQELGSTVQAQGTIESAVREEITLGQMFTLGPETTLVAKSTMRAEITDGLLVPTVDQNLSYPPPTPTPSIPYARSAPAVVSPASSQLLRPTTKASTLAVSVGKLGSISTNAVTCSDDDDGEDDGIPDFYSLSFQTKFIHHFWSHSWRANSKVKTLVLLLFYNSLPATLIATALAMGISGITAAGLMPSMVYRGRHPPKFDDSDTGYSTWGLCVGTLTFIAALVLWRPQQRIFLDKVCIHQKDAERKKAGVESIGAFLYHSQYMLVLWDPSYATRLWCIFEMAAFAWAHKEELKHRVLVRPIVFAPVFAGLFLCSAFYWGLGLLIPKDSVVAVTVFPVISALAGVVGIHFLRKFHRDMSILREHLKHFQVTKADCFCCSAKHKDPDTGARISCDREVIQGCIVAWFGSLDDFDVFVQTELAGYFQRSLGRFGLPFRWVIASQIPAVWSYCDYLGSRWHSQRDPYEVLELICEGLAMWLCCSPLTVAFVIWVTGCLHKKRGSHLVDFAFTVISALLALLPVAALALSWYVAKYIVAPSPVTGAAAYLVLTAQVTLAVFKWGRGDRTCMCG